MLLLLFSPSLVGGIIYCRTICEMVIFLYGWSLWDCFWVFQTQPTQKHPNWQWGDRYTNVLHTFRWGDVLWLAMEWWWWSPIVQKSCSSQQQMTFLLLSECSSSSTASAVAWLPVPQKSLWIIFCVYVFDTQRISITKGSETRSWWRTWRRPEIWNPRTRQFLYVSGV